MNDNDVHDDDDYEDDFATGKGNQCQSLVRWQQMSPFKGQDDDRVHYNQPIIIIGYNFFHHFFFDSSPATDKKIIVYFQFFSWSGRTPRYYNPPYNPYNPIEPYYPYNPNNP